MENVGNIENTQLLNLLKAIGPNSPCPYQYGCKSGFPCSYKDYLNNNCDKKFLI